MLNSSLNTVEICPSKHLMHKLFRINYKVGEMNDSWAWSTTLFYALGTVAPAQSSG